MDCAQSLIRLTNGDALETILLHAVELDNSNAPAIVRPGGVPLRQRGACAERRGLLALLQAELLHGCPKLHGISLENNNFTEEGLLTIADHCATRCASSARTFTMTIASSV